MAESSSLGKALFRERKAHRWTTRQLADKAGISHTTISRIERGERLQVEMETVRRLASALDMTPDELLGTSRPLDAPPPASLLGPTVLIPIVNISLAAGTTVYGETRETVPFPAERVRGRALVAARVTGDCMEPEIRPGDIAIVDIGNRSPRTGQLVVVLLEDGGMVVKRFSRDSEGPLLEDAKGGRYRPNGAKVQGVLVSILRDVD